MKRSVSMIKKFSHAPRIPAALTALTLALAAPGLATAANHAGHVHSMKPLTSANSLTSAKRTVTTGTLDSTVNGMGTYKTVTRVNPKTGNEVVRTTTDYADGVDVTTRDRIIKNANGSTTSDVTTINNGVRSQTDLTSTPGSTAGTDTITGTYTVNGQTDKVTGTRTDTSYGADTTYTYTNSAGKTETINYETLDTGNGVGTIATGTNFNGKAIDSASVRATNKPSSANDVDTVANGQGTYTTNTSTNNGVKDTYTADTFTNGTTSLSNTASTGSAADSTHDVDYYTVGGNGKVSYSDGTETFKSNGAGTTAISGTLSQSNGYNDTVSGTQTKTAYGTATDVSYTNQNGVKRTSDTETLKAGDATLNVTDGDTFSGKTVDNASLTTAK